MHLAASLCHVKRKVVSSIVCYHATTCVRDARIANACVQVVHRDKFEAGGKVDEQAVA